MIVQRSPRDNNGHIRTVLACAGRLRRKLAWTYSTSPSNVSFSNRRNQVLAAS